MSDNSPFFFMREFSNEDLVHLLVNKVKEVKSAKCEVEQLNERLQDTVSQLEETQQELVMQKQQLEDTNERLQNTVCELEETKQELVAQKESLQEQVEQKTNELLKSEKLATIGELSARIAHDLRNPLSVIKSTSEILQHKFETHLNEETLGQFQRLDRAIYRMQHQVEDVLDFLRNTPIKKSQTNVLTIINDALERITIPNNVMIHAPQNDHKIFCDPQKIEVVLVNLIMNAIQALEQKDGTIDIIVYDESKNDQLIIEIKDTGPGIPDDLQCKVFDPLFTTRQIGTGLGLPSCKNIIEKHGGSIDFETKVGFGTKFRIKLPKNSEWGDLHRKQSNPTNSKIVNQLK
jgi:signal transduction histidine kinase